MKDIDTIQKQYYSIGEVAKLLELNSSLIRFWESEFKEVSPRKNRRGNRMYTEADIEVLKKIQYLLKVQGYTIKGAKDQLKRGGDRVEQESKLHETLLKVRDFLADLRDSL